MEDISDATEKAESIYIYNDGEKTVYSSDEKPFKEIVAAWQAMTEGAHQMPAFGVSLDAHTREAMQTGLWVEFDFGKTVECWEMPFERLLIEVQKTYSGFNLIRYTAEHGYDGRCFYLDLVDKDMGDFSELLLNLSN